MLPLQCFIPGPSHVFFALSLHSQILDELELRMMDVRTQRYRVVFSRDQSEVIMRLVQAMTPKAEASEVAAAEVEAEVEV